MAYVLLCGAGLFAAITLLDGIWKTIALVPVLFFAEGIVETPTIFRYGEYREEWELANGTDLQSEEPEVSG